MEENKIYKIEITSPEKEKLTLEVHYDADVYGWADIFKTIMTWVTFDPRTIKEIIKDDEED